MPRIRQAHIIDFDVQFSKILIEQSHRANPYVVRYGIEHQIRCGHHQHAKEKLLSVVFFSKLIQSWETFVVPFRYWRFLGVQEAREQYPNILKKFGVPSAKKYKTAKKVYEISLFFKKTGLYDLAIEYIQWSVSVFDCIEEHRERVLLAKLELGELLRKQKQYTKALEILTLVIPQVEEHFHSSHEYAYRGKYYLANVHHDMDELDQAETLFVSILDFQVQTFGESHKSTLKTMNDLAMVYKEQERYEESESLYRRTIEFRQKLLGPMHPSTVDTIYNLAVLCKRLEKYQEAESLFTEIAKMDAYNLGEEHPDSILSLSFLASFYMELERYDAAEKIKLKLLDIQRGRFHSLHDDVLEAIGELAVLYSRQQNFSSAIVLYREIVDALSQREGADHIETQKAIFDWALCLVDGGDKKQGISSLCALLLSWEENFGVRHKQTLLISNELAHIFIQEQEYDRALELFLRDLSFQKQQNNIENCCWCHYNIAFCFQEKKAFQQAEIHFRESILCGVNHYGEDDIETASLYHDFAQFWSIQALFEDALEWRKRAYQIYMQSYGFCSAETQNIFCSLIHDVVAGKKFNVAYELLNPVQGLFPTLEQEILIQHEENICLLAMGLKEESEIEKAIEIHHLVISIQARIREPADPAIAIWKNNTAWLLLLETKEIPTKIFSNIIEEWSDTESWFYIWIQLGFELGLCKKKQPHRVEEVIESLALNLGRDHPRIKKAQEYWQICKDVLL